MSSSSLDVDDFWETPEGVNFSAHLCLQGYVEFYKKMKVPRPDYNLNVECYKEEGSE